MIRLDKYLALSGERSRSEAARLLRAGAVQVNGAVVRDGSTKVSEADQITLSGLPVSNSRWQYVMLHKPAGVLTAASDRRAPTVMDLVPEAMARRKVLPVGRLDKDTTGLLLLTNDGELAHRLLSPKQHVWKVYQATVTGRLTQEDAAAFERGLQLSDFFTKPAGLTLQQVSNEQSVALVELREGKFHQVKRMFSARGHEVLALHRISFGPLQLPDDLPVGQYRELTSSELAALKQSPQKQSGDEEQHG